MQRTKVAGLLPVMVAAALGSACGSGNQDTSTTGVAGSGAGGTGQGGTAGTGQGATAGTGQGGTASTGQGGTAGTGQGGTGGTGQGGSVSGCTGPGMDPDYAACGGDTFHPDGSCEDGACAMTELSQKVYAAWKARAMELTGFTESALLGRLEVSKVEQSDGPVYVWVRVEYVVALGWIRSRQADSVNLGDYPLQSTPSDAQIANAVKIGMEDAEWSGLAAIDDIVCPEEVEGAFATCMQGMMIDWCHVDFENVTGTLKVGAFGVVDANANQCKEARVDVTTGELIYCGNTPCEIM